MSLSMSAAPAATALAPSPAAPPPACSSLIVASVREWAEGKEGRRVRHLYLFLGTEAGQAERHISTGHDSQGSTDEQHDDDKEGAKTGDKNHEKESSTPLSYKKCKLS